MKAGETDTGDKERRRKLGLLFLALFNSILGLSILFPILAPLGRELSLSETEITSFSTAYAAMQLVTATFWGRRSDRGRKRVLLIGIVGFALSFYAFGSIAYFGRELPHELLFGGLLLARLIGGGLSSATIPTAQAYAADVSGRTERTRVMALIGAAFGLGVVFGPGIGAAIAMLTGSLYAPIFASATVAVLNAIFVFTSLPESRPEGGGTRKAISNHALVAKLWPLLIVGLVATLASVAMEQTVAFYFQDRLGIDEASTPKYVGGALVVYGLVAVFTQGFIARRLSLSPRTLVIVGVPIAALGFGLLAIADAFWILTIALAVQGLGHGMILPGVTAGLSLRVSEDAQGAAAGINSAAQGFARMVGPMVGGALYEIGMSLPYIFGAGLLAMMLPFVASFRRKVAGPRETNTTRG